MTKELHIKTDSGLRLTAFLESAQTEAQPLVILAHGYASGKNSRTNRKLIPMLVERGMACLSFDFRGHENSEGKIEDANLSTGLADFEAVINWARASGFRDSKLGLVGNSYGGAVAALYAERGNPDCIALKAPALDWSAARASQMNEDELVRWKETGVHNFSYARIKVATPYSFYEDLLSYDLYKNIDKIKCPVLIFHGTDDESVPCEQSVRFTELLDTQAELHLIENGDHRLLKKEDAENFANTTVNFLARNLLVED